MRFLSQEFCWRRDRLPTPVFLGFPCGSTGKESPCNAGDLGFILGLGRSPGEGYGYPVQYSALEISMDCIVHGVSKSWTQLSDFHFHIAHLGFPSGSAIKNLPVMQEMWVWSLGWEDPWRRAWQPTPVYLHGESYGQRSLSLLGLQRVRRDWATEYNITMHMACLLLWFQFWSGVQCLIKGSQHHWTVKSFSEQMKSKV